MYWQIKTFPSWCLCSVLCGCLGGVLLLCFVVHADDQRDSFIRARMEVAAPRPLSPEESATRM